MYLALDGGPPGFPQGSTCPVVLRKMDAKSPVLSVTGLSPALVGLSSAIHLRRGFVTLPDHQLDRKSIPFNTRTATELTFNTARVWALPLSLAATQGISV